MRMHIMTCARCGKEHKDVVAHRLQEPVQVSNTPLADKVVVLTHWCICPTTEEPVLFRMVGS
jgi:hypothetical protein